MSELPAGHCDSGQVQSWEGGIFDLWTNGIAHLWIVSILILIICTVACISSLAYLVFELSFQHSMNSIHSVLNGRHVLNLACYICMM